MTVDNNSAETFLSKGCAELERSNYFEAIDLFEKALQVEPENPQLLFQTARAYSKLGDYDKEIRFYNKVIELDPKSSKTFNNIALAYAKKGSSASTRNKDDFITSIHI